MGDFDFRRPRRGRMKRQARRIEDEANHAENAAVKSDGIALCASVRELPLSGNASPDLA